MKKYIAVLLLCTVPLGLFGCTQRLVANQITGETTEQATEPSTVPELSGTAVFEMIALSMVEISVTGDGFTRTGMGVFINDRGNILTNYHIIEGGYSISVKTFDGRIAEVTEIAGYSKEIGLAALSTSFADVTPVQLRMEKVNPGDEIFVAGSSAMLTSSFSEGVILAEKEDFSGQSVMQISVPVLGGNSGSPVLDTEGKMIGITNAGIATEETQDLAIPITKLNDIDMGTSCSVYEFFNLTKGEQQLQNLGSFSSLSKLVEETKRNPKNFEQPVVISVQGIIVRTTEDKIFLTEKGADNVKDKYNFSLIEQGKTMGSWSKSETSIEVIMKDDSSNRVLTGDVVILTGVYRYGVLTIFDCTYKIIGSVVE